MGACMDLKKSGVVLICDDHNDSLDVVATIVSKAGYTVYTAQNRDELMPLVESVKPDLLLCDIRMPEHDGFEIAEALKQRGSHFPIVLMTAYDSSFYHVYAPFVGAVDVVIKPIDSYQLLRQIDLVLGHSPECSKTRVLERLRRLREKHASPNAQGN